MPLKLYFTIASPPVRAVIYTLKALNVSYELVNIDLFQGDQLSERFLKLNPQHTIPTIKDEDGFVIWESHAINAYLVNKYGKDSTLYSKDPKARAIIDQRLHFDTGVLFPLHKTFVVEAIVKKTISNVSDEMVASYEEVYDLLEKFLKANQFVAGDDITIADFSILTTLTNASVFAPLNNKKYPKIRDYIKRSEAKIPNFEELEKEGKQGFTEILKLVNFKLN